MHTTTTIFKFNLAALLLTVGLNTLHATQGDSLYFKNTKDKESIVALPLNGYYMKMKAQKGKKQFVILNHLEDSMLYVNVWSPEISEEKAKRIVNRTYRNKELTFAQKDAAIKKLAFIELDSIHISELKYLAIDKFARHDTRKKRITNSWVYILSTTGIYLGTLFIFPPAYIPLTAIYLGGAIGYEASRNIRISMDEWELVDVR
jgi:hypothetical protein